MQYGILPLWGNLQTKCPNASMANINWKELSAEWNPALNCEDDDVGKCLVLFCLPVVSHWYICQLQLG